VPEEKKYSAAEIAAMKLPGLPTTKAKVLARAEREEWLFETKIGLGGVRKMFVIPPAYMPGYQPLPQLPETPRSGTADAIVKSAMEDGVQLNKDRLEHVISFLDNYLEENKIRVDAKKKAELIVAMYNLMKTTENEEDIKKILRLVA